MRLAPALPRIARGPAVSLALCFGLAATAAHAADHEAVRRAVEAGRLKPLAEILSQVEARHGARVLDVELERGPGVRPYYEIKLLERDGRRREVHIDAVSGAEVTPMPDQSGDWRPLADTVRAVLAARPGQVLDLELDRSLDGRPVYLVRIALADGRMSEIALDARTGAELQSEGRRLAPLSSLKPLPEILDQVRARYPGTVREVELERDRQGRRYYEFDIQLSDGRSVEVNVDAVTGKVLSDQPDD